ncbi:MAG: hypothetical protein R3Y35_00580 [Clostridia bacterium]
MKKVFALVIILAMTLTACSYGSNSWAIKDGDNEINMEEYLYYCLMAYENAVYMVDSETRVLDATIDSMTATEYIFSDVMRYCQTYLWLESQIEELDITYTDQEIDDVEYLTEAQMEYIGDYLEYYGISEDSFHTAYSIYSLNYQKVFEALYSEGGEFEVADEEFLEYYSENYYSYQYIFAPLMEVNEDNENISISEEDKEVLTELFEEYMSQIENGEKTLEECGEDYMELTDLEVAPYNDLSTKTSEDNFPTNFLENLEIMENGEMMIFESDSLLILMMKTDIVETAENLDDNSRLYSIMEDKWFEYNSYVIEQATTTMSDIEVNEDAISEINLEDFVTEYNEYGYSY